MSASNRHSKRFGIVLNLIGIMLLLPSLLTAQVFEQQISIPLQLDQIVSGRSIGVAPDGTIYVYDGVSYQMTKIASDGTALAKWGGPGNGNGQFSMDVLDVDVDINGDVYVC